MVKAVYPGSFDPITNGHLDIVQRASLLYDAVVVGVLNNTSKRALFSVDQRVALVREAVAHLPNVTVVAFSGLTVDLARELGARVLLRGLRTVADFDGEMRLALTNRCLYPDSETVFLMTDARHVFLSSSIIKELVSLGGSPAGMVPEHVARALIEICRGDTSPRFEKG